MSLPPKPERVAAANAEIAQLTGRAVEEWIGAHPDQPVPKRVKLRILLRHGGRCYRTGHKFRPGDVVEFDHILAFCNGGEHRETNIAPILGGKPHKAKTAADVAVKAKTDRMRAKNLGLWPRGKGFRRDLKHKLNGQVERRDGARFKGEDHG